MSTSTVPLTSGGAPAAVQVTGNTPAGHALINTDTAATVTITAGATGPILAALEPGGSLVWRDPAVYPYAYATGGAGTVVLVVTDQASDYSNPAAVAAVTAAQLAAQGIPSTFLDAGLGTWLLNASPGVGSSAQVTVGGFASLLIAAQWPQSPQSYAALRLTFDDPAVPDLPPISLYVGNNGNTSVVANEQGAWAVPVLAPRLTVTNLGGSANMRANLSVVGNNRAVDGLRQLGDELGARHFYGSCPVAGAGVVLVAANNNNITGTTGLSDCSRLNGPVTLNVETLASGGWIRASYVDATGSAQSSRIHVPGAGLYPWSHPRVPVSWAYSADASVATNYIRLTVSA